LEGEAGARKHFKNMGELRGTNAPAIICVNDDVTYHPQKVGALFKDWMARNWGTPAAWEEK